MEKQTIHQNPNGMIEVPVTASEQEEKERISKLNEESYNKIRRGTMPLVDSQTWKDVKREF